MKAACGAPPPATSSSTRHHGNDSRQGTVKQGRPKISTSQSHKMVMPPFLRLDSTGEVTSYERPDQSVGLQRTNAGNARRQGGSTMNGLFDRFMSNITPSSSSKQLAMPQVKTGVSALDELYNSRQALDGVAKAGLKPHVKMAQSSQPRFDRYGQWCVTHPNYAVLPQGIFPCHVFSALQSQNNLVSSPSCQFTPKTMWSDPLRESLMDTVKQFSAENKQPNGMEPELSHQGQPADSSALGASVDSPCSRSNASPCTVKKHSAACAVDNRENAKNVGTVPDVAEVSQAALEAGIHTCDKLSNDIKVPSGNQNSLNQGLVSNENKSMLNCEGSTCAQNQLTRCENNMERTQPPVNPSTCNDQSVYICDPEAKLPQQAAAAALSCDNHKACNIISENPKRNGDVELKKKDMREQERTGAWCLQLLTQQKNTSADAQNESPNVGNGRFFVATFQVQPSYEEVDWDEGETDDEGEESDFVAQADTVGIFMLGGLTVSSILSTPCRQRQQDREEEEGETEKVPPKPCPAATRRWNKHYPSDPPQHRVSKVRFACGQEMDRVHLYEGDTLTVMEIQKARDLSRHNKGKAASLLKNKFIDPPAQLDTPTAAVHSTLLQNDLTADTAQLDNPTTAVPSTLDHDVETDSGDVCDGIFTSHKTRIHCIPSEEKLADVIVAGVEKQDPKTGAISVCGSGSDCKKSDRDDVSLQFDASDLGSLVSRGGSESSDCSDEDDDESDSDDGQDDDESDADDDIVFE